MCKSVFRSAIRSIKTLRLSHSSALGGIRRYGLKATVIFGSLFGLVLTSGQQPAAAQTQKALFDSAQCDVDPEGMIHIALWEVVVRIKAEDLFYVRNFPAVRLQKAPNPPRPDVLEGCPGNPIRAQGFRIRLPTPGLPENLSRPKSDYPPLLRLDLISSEPDHFGMQPLRENAYGRCVERSRSVGPELERLPNGLYVCRFKPINWRTDNDKESWPFSAQSDPSIYKTPTGRAFTIQCWRRLFRKQICFVSYKYSSLINISYRFYRNDYIINNIVFIDKKIRNSLNNSIIKDYEWE